MVLAEKRQKGQGHQNVCYFNAALQFLTSAEPPLPAYHLSTTPTVPGDQEQEEWYSKMPGSQNLWTTSQGEGERVAKRQKSAPSDADTAPSVSQSVQDDSELPKAKRVKFDQNGDPEQIEARCCGVLQQGVIVACETSPTIGLRLCPQCHHHFHHFCGISEEEKYSGAVCAHCA